MLQVLTSRNLDEHVVAAPLLGQRRPRSASSLLHALGIGAGLVDLVDGHDDGNIGCLGVVDGLDGLRHDTVIGGNDQDDHIGDLRTTRAHGGKRLMARGVDEGDLIAVDPNHGCTDGLRDATGLGLLHARIGEWRRAARSCRGRRDP